MNALQKFRKAHAVLALREDVQKSEDFLAGVHHDNFDVESPESVALTIANLAAYEGLVEKYVQDGVSCTEVFTATVKTIVENEYDIIRAADYVGYLDLPAKELSEIVGELPYHIWDAIEVPMAVSAMGEIKRCYAAYGFGRAHTLAIETLECMSADLENECPE